MADRDWISQGIGADAFGALAEGLPAAEVWSLLLEAFARRAAARTPADVRQQYSRDGFVQPALIDQRVFNDLDRHLLAAAHEFEAIELAPLAPLAACSSVARTSQNRIVSALRGTEVVSDPTNVLAVECAARLQADAGTVVRLATSHRAVRAQPFPKLPGFAPHFRIFCLASGGREQASHGFVAGELIRHVRTYLAALERLEANGYAFPNRRLAVLATPEHAEVADRIAAAIGGLPVSRGALTHEYYDGLRFQIAAGDHTSGIPLIDGGAFDWLSTLTSNRKMAFVASGMGSQLAAFVFRDRTGSSGSH
jgi:hypothetical protein